MKRTKGRGYGYDNLRVFLIFCVVFGHLLELIGSRQTMAVRDGLYFLIYSFHIPVLIFLNGLFARFSWKRVAYLFALYLLFQTVYLLFRTVFLGYSFEFQFREPYWHLWYLATLLSYFLLLPILERIPTSFAIPVSAMSFLLSLAAGFDESIGYEFSLSRTLVFFPFFVIGHFAGRRKKSMRHLFFHNPMLGLWLGCAALIATGLMYFSGLAEKNMLYGSYSYAAEAYSPLIRLWILLTAALWTGALLALFLSRVNRPVPFVSVIGRNTLPVFLLHGFAVRLLDQYNVLGSSFTLAAVCAVLLVALLGNPWTGGFFRGPRRHPA